MAVKKRRKKKLTWRKRWINFKSDDRIIKLLGVCFLLMGIYLAIAFVSYLYSWKIDQDKVLHYNWTALWQDDLQVANWLGRLGAVISNLFFYWGFGLMSILFIPLSVRLGFDLIRKRDLVKLMDWFQMLSFFILFGSIILAFIFQNSDFPWGGAFGQSACIWLSNFIGGLGLGFLIIFGIGAYVIWKLNPDFQQVELSLPGMGSFKIPNISFKYFKQGRSQEHDNSEGSGDLSEWNVIKEGVRSGGTDNMTEEEKKGREKLAVENDHLISPDIVDFPLASPKIPTGSFSDKDNKAHTDLEINLAQGQATVDQPDKIIEQNEVPMEPVLHITEENRFHLEPFDPTSDLKDYRSPTLDLLIDYDKNITINRAELEANKDKIIETLLHYKIEIIKIRATIGPTVTLYEIIPAPGVRISKIKGLEDDIALNLSAMGIRIIAPIPGKGTIGIEVPNKTPQIVSLREVLDTDKFKNVKMDLPIAIGKTISNEVYVVDLAKMPHLLVAGATGQGKSVGINAILISLLYKKHPSQLKLILIDPKKVELPIYNEINKHFLAFLPDQEEPIITDTEKVINTLNSLVIEMDDRYDLLKKARVRNIKEYNKKFVDRNLNPENGHKFMPFIVLVIDEFADLIMTAGKEIELPIARLAQLARAVGIHLIIATQRPSVKIITGMIKANFPARIAFRVTSNIDSRTILDQGGAEQLIGRGDMLMTAGSDIVRLQCAFVDTPEVEKVNEFIGAQKGFAEPYYLPEYKGEESVSGTNLKATELDALFKDAATLVVQQQHGSTSMIQRRMKLGYNRAGRIMDQLEMLGIVGAADGSKAREVFVYSVQELEHILNNIFGSN